MNGNNKQTIILVLLFLVFAFHVGRHINNFYVPESDFFDYRAKAVNLREFEMPENFKRPPLYPTLIAIVSIPFQGKFRELYAAELIIALSAIFSLFFVYRISSFFLGKRAFWIAWIFALHPITLRMAIKPKPEMLVAVFILWAFDRFLKGDKRAYLLAFFAAMVRYEGALLIVAFFVVDFFCNKERLKSLLFSALAGLPLVFWTLLQSGGNDGGSYGNYFTAYKPNFIFPLTFWDGLVRFLPVQLFKLWVLMGSGLVGIGLFYGFKNFRKETIAFVTFLASFILMHIIWPFSNVDYIVIVSWIVMLLVAFALIWINQTFSNKLNSLFGKNLFFVFGCLCLFAVLYLIGFYRFPFPQYNVDALTMIFFLIPAILYLVFQAMSMDRYKRTVYGLTLIVLFAFLLNSKTNADFFDIHYAKAEFRKAGEWFEDNRTPGEKLAITQPTVVSYFTNLNAEKDFERIINIPPGGPKDVLNWLRANNISHIAWLSTNKIQKDGDTWKIWQADNRGWKTIKFLENGTDYPGFNKVHEIREGPRWGYIYKVES
jgi:hypothetical protein